MYDMSYIMICIIYINIMINKDEIKCYVHVHAVGFEIGGRPELALLDRRRLDLAAGCARAS